MRGVVTIQIKKRLINDSWKFKDKWDILDVVRLVGHGKDFYKTYSKYRGKSFVLTRDELAFVRFIYTNYGPGDFNIQIFGKGKNRGFRRFWDGLIYTDGRYLRRKEMSHLQNAGFFARDGINAQFTESYVGKYMKTTSPGVWHSFQ